MSDLLLSADLHLGHQKVAEIRGYTNVALHDHDILNNLADALTEKSELWILGDISAGGKAAQERALLLLSELVDTTGARLHLIPGNHDGVHPMHRKSLNWYDQYLDVFKSAQPFARRRLDGHRVWLSHFPWLGAGDHTEDERYQTARLNHIHPEDWLLHGHTHSETALDVENRMINVGLDAWDMKPVPYFEIEKAIKAVEEELSHAKEQHFPEEERCLTTSRIKQ